MSPRSGPTAFATQIEVQSRRCAEKGGCSWLCVHGERFAEEVVRCGERRQLSARACHSNDLCPWSRLDECTSSSRPHSAVQHVRDLCEKWRVDPNRKTKHQDNGGLWPLHAAVRNKHHQVVRFLLERGADVDIRDKTAGMTPLHFACQKHDLEAIRLLRGTALANAKTTVRTRIQTSDLTGHPHLCCSARSFVSRLGSPHTCPARHIPARFFLPALANPHICISQRRLCCCSAGSLPHLCFSTFAPATGASMDRPLSVKQVSKRGQAAERKLGLKRGR